ncbi:MAG: DEAD/DEAH box helicase [Candidatus Hydrogenedentota bacterium]
MKMSELVRYGIPPEILQLWEEGESDRLLPLQEAAVKEHGLFGEGNLLFQAPTSSGKTFIGEMAALQTALRRKKVVYLVPLKALAGEKYRLLREKYAPYGVKVIVSSRDHREYDGAFEAGDFSIAVVVYEKLAQLLVRRPERLHEIELVIADELEILSDPDRGAAAELLLTRVLEAGARVIGLSAVLGGADRLAEWMDARLAAHDRRPVELRYGVIHEGVFRYRTYNALGEAEEPAADAQADSVWELVTQNLLAFVERGESCLVFVKARRESRLGAERLAERLDEPAAAEAIEALRGLESTHSRECLLNTLNSGVAFHNADLAPEERHVVEEAFRRGEVKALVSTSTLAQGLNLPARNVFLSTDKWRYDRRFGMPWKTPILRSEYENMSGRAGRYGAGHDFGRAILIAPTAFDCEALWRRYVEGARERIEPRLAREPLGDHVLRAIAARACQTEPELQRFFHRTLTGRWIWRETLPPAESEARVRDALEQAIGTGMAARGAHDRLEVTPVGQAVAAKGIAMETAGELQHWLRETGGGPWPDVDLLLAAALTPCGRMLHAALSAQEYAHAEYLAWLKRLTADEPLDADTPLNRLRQRVTQPFFEEVRAVKVALLLLEWMDQASMYALEERFAVFGGQVLAAADQLGWLLDAAAALAEASGAEEALVRRIATLAERVQHGLREEALPLARLGLPGLTRNVIAALAADGLTAPKAIAQCNQAALAGHAPAETARELQAWAQQQQPAPAEGTSPAPTEPVLVVSDARPGEIRLDGVVIPVQEKQYRLIRALAACPGECVPHETLYEAIWGETIVEPNQRHFQKGQLTKRIAKARPERKDLIRAIPKRGLLLDLPPTDVRLDAARREKN